ncbi:proline-specific permease [Trichomonascus vanleenenianus]|uniref:proline permease PUT4 n=1 Tax=Trichomonascus vanleenenianus TaxID=2268995 RepID=UPI003ECB6304
MSYEKKQPTAFEYANDLPNQGFSEVDKGVVGEVGDLHRGLKSRHIQLIALGGCIGTGLFVGSGTMLASGGPASVFVSYVIMSFVIWCMMNILGEMTTWLPLHGVSPTLFVHKYVDTSLSFACGWNYWYAYAFLVPSEVTAASIVVEYWTKAVPTAAWIAIVLVVIIALNISVVSVFGEIEFWFASIKIITIIGLIILGIVLFFGGGPTHDRLGFRYWEHDAFKEYIVTGAGGRMTGFWYCLIRSGFSFIMSPELICIAAGEAEAPRRNIPKAASRFIYRLVFFYIFGALVIGVTVSATDPRLLSQINAGSSDAAASPFVIGIQNAGIPVLNHIVNAAILTSAWSSGNSFLYAGSRTLFSLARDGEAPRIFKRCNRWGVPYFAVLATSAIGCLAFLNVSSSSANVFTWFSNISTVSGFIAWLCVITAYLRFRKAMFYNGIFDSLPFKAPFQPYSSYIAFFIVSIITITNGFTVFVGDRDTWTFNAPDFVAAYITLPLFAILYIGHKIYTRNWAWARPIESLDVTTGLDEAEAIERMYPEREPRNVFERVWFWIA